MIIFVTTTNRRIMLNSNKSPLRVTIELILREIATLHYPNL